MHEFLASEFIFFPVYLHNPDADHDSPQRCITRSRVLVKSPCAVSDPNPDIHEFLVQLNPKLSDPDVLTRIGFSSVHISVLEFFLAAAQDI